MDDDSENEAIDDLDLTSRSAYAPPSDEEISGDDDNGDDHQRETATQKRLRLAKAYIEKIKEDVGMYSNALKCVIWKIWRARLTPNLV